MKELSPEQVEALLENDQYEIIDVREDEEVAQGMIPGAKHIVLGSLENRMDELDKSKEQILICRSGRRSEMAAMLLEEQGFKTTNMVGGMLEWTGEVK
ncbi:rhodanese-like domain-containing protein [Radiobacillus kanasensis]|uniref:rhodanese-like domain-containing protein n=1 Tax=Radiobacillus kanasensis TaxID=2844358 RepID=UPI001E34ED14|nr:rhodanese-like domain-containing protein [Radiobacillus kanasensis]UFU01186.1 rhodanese-like domain-containing protein [Radiobacillus kanasensis]